MEAKINTRSSGSVYGLCSVRNAIFKALPYKHNGQAALKSTIKVKHCFTYSISSLQRQIKEKACVSPIHMSSKCVFKMTFLQSIFAGFLVALGPFCLYEDFDDRISKESAGKSLKNTSVTIIIKAFIPAYDSTAQD